MDLKTLSGYDLSPTFTTSQEEEKLVRELVENSSYESGSTEPISCSNHSSETLKVTMLQIVGV